MPSYLVTWEIDADEVSSPLEAAQRARAAQTREGTTATVFTVTDKDTKVSVKVDITPDDEEGPTVSDALPSRSPVRVIVDLSGGLFLGAAANGPVEVLAIDEEDKENPRAVIPGFDGTVWAGHEDAEVHVEKVNAAFDGIKWLED